MLSYGLWTPDYTNVSKELCSWNDHPHGQICSEIETWLQHDRKHEGIFQSAFLRTAGLIQPRVTPRQGVSTMQRYRRNLSRREGPNDGCREARKRMQPKKKDRAQASHKQQWAAHMLLGPEWSSSSRRAMHRGAFYSMLKLKLTTTKTLGKKKLRSETRHSWSWTLCTGG